MAGLILSNRTNRAARTNGNYRDPLSAFARDFFSWEPLGIERRPTPPPSFAPQFNVIETATTYVAEADLPGVAEGDVDVTLDGRVLTISGKREERTEQEGDKSHVVERRVGSFTRSFTLPDSIEGDSISANLAAGVLTVTIPKTPAVTPRKIPVASAK